MASAKRWLELALLWITESEVLVLGGLALAAVSLYRQRYGAGSAPGEQELHPEQGLLPGGDEFAEESKSQPEKSSKDQITRVWRPRLAKRPHKDQKGHLDEAAHRPNPQSRASTAKGSKENPCCNGSQSSFPGLGGIVHVQGFRTEDRAHTCQSHVEESSWPPTGIRALGRGQGSAGPSRPSITSSAGHQLPAGNQHDQAPEGHQFGIDHQHGPGAAQPKRRGNPHERGSIAVATTWWPFGHDAHGGELDHDRSEQCRNPLWIPLNHFRMMDRLEVLQRLHRQRQVGFNKQNRNVDMGWMKKESGRSVRGTCQRSRRSHTWRRQANGRMPFLDGWFASMGINVPACSILCTEKHRKWNSWESIELQSSSWRTATGWSNMMNGCLRTRYLQRPTASSGGDSPSLSWSRGTRDNMMEFQKVMNMEMRLKTWGRSNWTRALWQRRLERWVHPQRGKELLQWLARKLLWHLLLLKQKATNSRTASLEEKGLSLQSNKSQKVKKGNRKGTTSKTSKKGSTSTGTCVGGGDDDNETDDGGWVDEVEDDDEDGSFELVDRVSPQHVQPSSQTPSHGSNLEQHRGPALRSLRVAMEKRVTEENKVKGATEENQVKKTDEEDIQVAEDGYLRLPGWTTGRSKLSMPRPSQPTAMGVDITEVAWRELEQQRRARKAHSNPVTLLPASSMASSGSTSTAPRVMLKPATESKGPGEEVHEQQGEKALEGQVEKAPEKPRKVSASQGPKDAPQNRSSSPSRSIGPWEIKTNEGDASWTRRTSWSPSATSKKRTSTSEPAGDDGEETEEKNYPDPQGEKNSSKDHGWA